MTTFFIPFATSTEQAERVYQTFRSKANYPLLDDKRRLQSIGFEHDGAHYAAEVGKDILGWPEQAGPVLAIIETTQLVYVHTQLRGGLTDTPVYVSTQKVYGRLYFDAPPAHSEEGDKDT